jgi:hypothetical protein
MHVQKSPGHQPGGFCLLSKTLQSWSLQIAKGCVRACFLHANTHAYASALMHARKRAHMQISKMCDCVGATFSSRPPPVTVVTIEFFIEILGLIAALFIFVRYLFLQRNVTWY